MKKFILVTGGTGLIGQPIVDALVRQNQPVKVLTRNPQPSANPLLEYVRWNPRAMQIDPDAVANVSGILHLAGAPVAQRWTAAAKQAILNSRTQSTALLAQAIASDFIASQKEYRDLGSQGAQVNVNPRKLIYPKGL